MPRMASSLMFWLSNSAAYPCTSAARLHRSSFGIQPLSSRQCTLIKYRATASLRQITCCVTQIETLGLVLFIPSGFMHKSRHTSNWMYRGMSTWTYTKLRQPMSTNSFIHSAYKSGVFFHCQCTYKTQPLGLQSERLQDQQAPGLSCLCLPSGRAVCSFLAAVCAYMLSDLQA